MSTYTWSFLKNPFLDATEHNYQLAVKMSADYLASLQADKTNPQIAPLIVIYAPLDKKLSQANSNWAAQGGTQQSDTLQLKLLLKSLGGTKAKAWDIAVQAVFADTTMEYKALFPHHRIPFYSSTQSDRIKAVSALSTNLAGIVPLEAVKTDVDAFLTSIQDAITGQKTSIKTTGNFSQLVEDARTAACTQIFGDYGTLLSQNAGNPTAIGKYFPIKYIHDHAQIFFTKLLNVGQVYTVAKHTFGPTDQVTVTTNSAASIQLYAALKKDTPNTKTGMAFAGNTKTTIFASQLGDIANFHELMAANNDPNLQADFDIEFL
jgi:hypothetical protein